MMLIRFSLIIARLWVHFTCLWLMSFYGLYLLYKVGLWLDSMTKSSLGEIKSSFCSSSSLNWKIRVHWLMQRPFYSAFNINSKCCSDGWPFSLQEYKEILGKRIHRLRIIRHRPDQFTVLVRGIPLCTDHKARGCSVDHFFSKHHPYSYHSYQMMYDGSHLEDLLVR